MQPSSPSDNSQPAAAAHSDAAAGQAPAPIAPDAADDGDLIEKAWVLKVKQILSAAADNPYEQNKQLTLLKAEYMQKRYGKDIKVDS